MIWFGIIRFFFFYLNLTPVKTMHLNTVDTFTFTPNRMIHSLNFLPKLMGVDSYHQTKEEEEVFETFRENRRSHPSKQ